MNGPLLLCIPPPAMFRQVIIPGSAGEYGVTAGHSPIVAELKPGVVQVLHEPVSHFHESNLMSLRMIGHLFLVTCYCQSAGGPL